MWYSERFVNDWHELRVKIVEELKQAFDLGSISTMCAWIDTFSSSSSFSFGDLKFDHKALHLDTLVGCLCKALVCNSTQWNPNVLRRGFVIDLDQQEFRYFDETMRFSTCYDFEDLPPIFWSVADYEYSWRKRVRAHLQAVCIAFYPIEMPPYVLLEIFDAIPLARPIHHVKKIDFIFAMLRACSKVEEIRLRTCATTIN